MKYKIELTLEEIELLLNILEATIKIIKDNGYLTLAWQITRLKNKILKQKKVMV